MQNKYLSALKTAYASFGFSKEALDRVALQRVKTIASEDEISADVASHDTLMLMLKEMQGATDALRNEKAKIQKELDDFKKPGQSDVQPDNALAEQVASLKTMLEGMQTKMAEKEADARKESLINEVHAKMKAMGCVNDYIRTTTLSGLQFGDSDTADSIAEKMKSAYDENFRQAFGDGYTPPKGKKEGMGDDVDFGSMVETLKKSGVLPK